MLTSRTLFSILCFMIDKRVSRTARLNHEDRSPPARSFRVSGPQVMVYGQRADTWGSRAAGANTSNVNS